MHWLDERGSRPIELELRDLRAELRKVSSVPGARLDFRLDAATDLKEALSIEGDRIATDGWEAYPILKFSEIPPIDVELIERPDLPPLGVGETAVGPTGAAIANAVKRALGLRMLDLPLTRDAIRAAINQ